MKKALFVLIALLLACPAQAELKTEMIGMAASTAAVTGTYVTVTGITNDKDGGIYIGDRQGSFYYEVEVENCVIDVELMAGQSSVVSTHRDTGVDSDDNDFLDDFSPTSGPNSDGYQRWYPTIYIPGAPYISMAVIPQYVTGTGIFKFKFFGKREKNK